MIEGLIIGGLCGIIVSFFVFMFWWAMLKVGK